MTSSLLIPKLLERNLPRGSLEIQGGCGGNGSQRGKVFLSHRRALSAHFDLIYDLGDVRSILRQFLSFASLLRIGYRSLKR